MIDNGDPQDIATEDEKLSDLDRAKRRSDDPTNPEQSEPSEGEDQNQKNKLAFAISKLLNELDGADHSNLSIRENIRNIKGELISVVLSGDETEIVAGVKHKVTYTITLAGQRYKADGTPGRLVSTTFLTKDLDDGEFYSEVLVDNMAEI